MDPTGHIGDPSISKRGHDFVPRMPLQVLSEAEPCPDRMPKRFHKRHILSKAGT